MLFRYFIRKKYIEAVEHKYFKLMCLFISLFWFSTSGFLYFEKSVNPELSWVDSIWWVIVTMTTVGYGDFFPVTTGGRFLIAVPTMIIGIGILGFIISEASTHIIESRSKKMRGQSKSKHDEHVVIFNYTNFDKVMQLVLELRSDTKTKDLPIVLIDEHLEALPIPLHEKKVHFVKGNPTHAETLKRANINQASYAMILAKDPNNIHSDDMNLSIAIVMESMNKDIFSIAEVLDPQKKNQLALAGCDSVICISEFSTNFFIQEIQDPGVKDIIFNLTSNRFGEQVYLCPLNSTSGKTYKDLVMEALNKEFSVFGLVRNDEALLSCKSADGIQEGDKAILVGKNRPETLRL